jgi:hypothetical protein
VGKRDLVCEINSEHINLRVVSDSWRCVLLTGSSGWWWFLCEGMEWRFFVEAKSFLFSMKEDEAVVRLEERRKGFAGVLSMGLPCTV